MTSSTLPTISPTLSAIVDGQTADAADVTTPFNELSAYITNAQQRVSVSSADTHFKHLSDAIAVSGDITKAIANPGANESLTLTVPVTGLVRLTARTELSVDTASISFSSIASDYKHLLLLANLRSSTGSSSGDDLIVTVNSDSGNYYSNLTEETTHTNTLTTAKDVTTDALGGWRIKNCINNATATGMYTPVRIWLYDIKSDDAIYMAAEVFLHMGDSGKNALIRAGGFYKRSGGGGINTLNGFSIKPSGSLNFLSGSSYSLYGFK